MPRHTAVWPARLPMRLSPPTTSLWANMAISARRFPDKTALVFMGRSWSYLELLAACEHMAGHLARLGVRRGDRVLLDFAQRVTGLLRRPDLLARFGGEEFVLLLPETTQDEALAVAERILARVAEPAEGLPPITVSIGVATNRPDEAEIDTLLARADKALYQAKDEGRNRVEAA